MLSLLSGEGKPVGNFVDEIPERVTVDVGVVEPVHEDRPIEDLQGLSSLRQPLRD